jgi:acyl carrier protein
MHDRSRWDNPSQGSSRAFAGKLSEQTTANMMLGVVVDSRTRIRRFVVEEILKGGNQPASLGDDDSLVNSGLLNSLSIVEIIAFIEQQFNVDIGDGEIDINDFDSVNRICLLIERRGAGAAQCA